MFFRAYRIGVVITLLLLLASLHVRADALPEESCPFFVPQLWTEGLEIVPTGQYHGEITLYPGVVGWSPDGKRLAVEEQVPPDHAAPEDRWISVLNLDTREVEQRLNQPFGVFSMAWSPDSAQLAAVNGLMRVWEIGRRAPAFEVETVGRIVWSLDGRELAVIGSTNITILDPASGRQLRVIDAHGQIPDALASWSPEGLTWTADSGDANARNYQVWRENQDTPLLSFGPEYNRESAVLISPSGQLVAARRDDAGVELWDVETGELVQTLDEDLTSIRWSADERCIAAVTIDTSAGYGRYIPKLWDVATGRKMVLPEGIDTIYALSPDGTMLAATDDVGGLTIWRVPQGD